MFGKKQAQIDGTKLLETMKQYSSEAHEKDYSEIATRIEGCIGADNVNYEHSCMTLSHPSVPEIGVIIRKAQDTGDCCEIEIQGCGRYSGFNAGSSDRGNFCYTLTGATLSARSLRRFFENSGNFLNLTREMNRSFGR